MDCLSIFHILNDRMWEAPPGGGVVPSHKRQDKYTIFSLQQIQPFLTNSRRLPFCIPALKGGDTERKILIKL